MLHIASIHLQNDSSKRLCICSGLILPPVNRPSRQQSVLYAQQLRRFNYVTPKNYLDYIENYKKLLLKNRTARPPPPPRPPPPAERRRDDLRTS